MPWQRAGSPISLDMKAVPGISLVYDALFVALTHTPATGRRHLIVAMTDGGIHLGACCAAMPVAARTNTSIKLLRIFILRTLHPTLPP